MTNHISNPPITPELAYFCGVIAGDGCITIRENKHDYNLTCLGNANDEQSFYDNRIIPLFKNIFGFSPRIRHNKIDNTYGMTISSKELVRFLINIGLPKGNKYERICIPIKFKERDLRLAFIRGVFDTDGCMCFKRRYHKTPYYPVISMSTKSERFRNEIAQALTKEGFSVVHAKIVDKKERQGFPLGKRYLIQMNGYKNFLLWQERIQFWSPKHNAKIARIRFELMTSGL